MVTAVEVPDVNLEPQKEEALALAEAGPRELPAIISGSPWRWQRFGEQIAAVLQALPSPKPEAQA